MKKLCLHPLFSVGLMIRLLLIASMMPVAAGDWYVPFLDVSVSSFVLDPWSTWISSGGTPVAFPYGFAMWLMFLPLTLVAKLLGTSLQYGYALTLLGVDVGLLYVLHRLLPGRRRLLLIAYWLSPFVIVASYVLGMNDLVPALLLAWSMWNVRKVRLGVAGFLLVAAISAKLSMVVAFPFYVIYFFNNKSLRQYVVRFMAGCLACAAIFLVPFAFSVSGLQMLFGNPEMEKIYQVVVDTGGGGVIYPVPLTYVLMLYLAWRVRRLNFDLFQAITGMAFLLIVLMLPASPGWFVWSVPFLVLYQAMSGRMAVFLAAMFSGLYVLGTLLNSQIRLINGLGFSPREVLHLNPLIEGRVTSLLHTTMIAIGVLLALRIWREGIRRNDFFRQSRKPFVIGVAGDSGAGKDTFANAISGLFGAHSVAKMSGDDYHFWDRQKPMWHVLTHLNPMANDLERFSSDLISLADGKSIQSRHYDHHTGKMSKPIRIASNDFIIASGLHALYLPILRNCCSLKIYLDIDEGLRRYFKIKRDVSERGHSLERVLSSFEKRQPDSERFIKPQANHADLVFSLQPIHPRMLENLSDHHHLRLKLVVQTRRGFNELSLNRILLGVCGLQVDMGVSSDGGEVRMTIEGDTSASDINMAAQMLYPQMLEFLDTKPEWQDGMMGLMQLITLSHISQEQTKRFI
jgi:uridine kinase